MIIYEQRGGKRNMKYMKERKFVKFCNEVLQEEVNVNKITILESSSKNKEINYVMYEDRFGRQWMVDTYTGKVVKREYIK